jgi:hypothetical protein
VVVDSATGTEMVIARTIGRHSSSSSRRGTTEVREARGGVGLAGGR